MSASERSRRRARARECVGESAGCGLHAAGLGVVLACAAEAGGSVSLRLSARFAPASLLEPAEATLSRRVGVVVAGVGLQPWPGCGQGSYGRCFPFPWGLGEGQHPGGLVCRRWCRPAGRFLARLCCSTVRCCTGVRCAAGLRPALPRCTLHHQAVTTWLHRAPAALENYTHKLKVQNTRTRMRKVPPRSTRATAVWCAVELCSSPTILRRFCSTGGVHQGGGASAGPAAPKRLTERLSENGCPASRPCCQASRRFGVRR